MDSIELALADGARLEPYSWPIPSLSAAGFGSLTVSGPGWFLAGDAAGLVDPITREGIYFALRSGELAAQAAAVARRLARALPGTGPRRDCGGPRAVRRATRPGSSGRASRGCSSTRCGERRDPDVMADLVAGRRAYSSLKWSLAGTFEVGLAWRLITAS